ncbi:unnamed protein product [Rotaria sp. Silwood1]|nr:unnamed protein product [Rotaria sp. Silwood1]CAF1631215.1 unnamed protein product [Rotaria sp. Silwood1]CAF3819374.1 unnamed protein product [Rotaria sp. Silwood1]CAF3832589.1 unnamed protein product [Rotaria sp. Silwood1]CAF5021237.1 unnamed protein product [Rotaria sp. Silwood1]
MQIPLFLFGFISLYSIASSSDTIIVFPSSDNQLKLQQKWWWWSSQRHIFTGTNTTGISGSRNDKENPPGKVEILNCTFEKIGNGVINRFTKLSIVGVIVIQAQWFSIELLGLIADQGITVHDIFILDSGNGLIIHEIVGPFIFWNIFCHDNENGGLIIFDTLSGPLVITESTFDNNRIANVFISNSYSVVVLNSWIRNARPKSDDTYGDGFVAMKNKEPIELHTSNVYDNYRAGVSVWGGRLILIDDRLHGHKFDLNYETYDGIPGDFDGSTGNVCSDYPPGNICAALSSRLAPPSPISPTH